jgi:hypothetical protein
MQMGSKSVSNNFMSEHKSVWHLKEIIYFEEMICSILNVVECSEFLATDPEVDPGSIPGASRFSEKQRL